jgi:hypothetical protein
MPISASFACYPKRCSVAITVPLIVAVDVLQLLDDSRVFDAAWCVSLGFLCASI